MRRIDAEVTKEFNRLLTIEKADSFGFAFFIIRHAVSNRGEMSPRNRNKN